MSTPDPKVQEVTSTQNTAPWTVQQPHLKHGFSEARKIYDAGPNQFFPGQTYAPTDPATTAGLNAMEARATAGSPVLNAANAESAKTISGGYLDGNPYIDGMINRTAADVLPRLGGQFAGSGGPGGLQTRAATLALADSANSLRYGNYNAERDRMTGAVAGAPNLAMAGYTDPAMLGQVGAAREAIAQQGINENIARHDYAEMAPEQALAQYMQMISGNYGGQSTGTTQQLIPQANPWMQALGIASNVAGSALGMYAKSDVRAKTDIERVGSMDDGTNIYRYRYKSGGPPLFGVMAQEVAETKPEAVAMLPDGYLGVNYAAL